MRGVQNSLRPVPSFFVVLAAAFGHASWNLLPKKARGGTRFVWIYSAFDLGKQSLNIEAIFFG